MEVWIKSLEVDMQIKQKGIELEVRSKEGQIGDCYATMTGLIWCRGKTQKENGVKIRWEDFQVLCSSDESLKAAIKAAKEVAK